MWTKILAHIANPSDVNRLSSDSVSISDRLTAIEQSLDGFPMAVANCIDHIDDVGNQVQASQPGYSSNALS